MKIYALSRIVAKEESSFFLLSTLFLFFPLLSHNLVIQRALKTPHSKPPFLHNSVWQFLLHPCPQAKWKIRYLHAEDWNVTPLSHTVHSSAQMQQRPNVRLETLKLLQDTGTGNDFFGYDLKSSEIKSTNWQMGF